MSRIVTAICAVPKFTSFGSLTYLGGATGKTNGVSHGMAATQVQIWGFAHLATQTVSAFIGGLDCGDYTVAADGSITVPMASDPDGLLSEAYLAGLNSATQWGELAATVVLNGLDTPTTVTIPVAVGLAYTTRGQIVRPATTADIHTPTGQGFGMIRRLYQYGILFHNTVNPYIGTDFGGTLLPARLVDGGQNALTKNVMFNGIAWAPISDGSSFDGMISWQVQRPYPVTVSAVSGFLHVGERE